MEPISVLTLLASLAVEQWLGLIALSSLGLLWMALLIVRDVLKRRGSE